MERLSLLMKLLFTKWLMKVCVSNMEPSKCVCVIDFHGLKKACPGHTTHRNIMFAAMKNGHEISDQTWINEVARKYLPA